MTTMREKIRDFVTQEYISTSLSYGGGYAIGYGYASWNVLPKERVAQYFAIWGAVSGAFGVLVGYLTTNEQIRAGLNATFTCVSAALAITKLRRADFIGTKMMITLALINLFAIIGFSLMASGVQTNKFR